MILFGLVMFCSSIAVGSPFKSISVVWVEKDIKYENCPGIEGCAKVSTVDINPCPGEPCVFKRGTTVNTTVTFTLTKEVTDGTLKVYGIITHPVKLPPIPLPIDQPDICQDHNLKCPLNAGTEYKFFLTLVVKSYFPTVPLTIRAQVKDKEGKDVICIQFKGQIVG